MREQENVINDLRAMERKRFD